MNLRPKYIRDENGKTIKPEKFIARETVGWIGAIQQAIKETVDSGKQFVKEGESSISDFGRELANAKKKKK